LLRDGASFRLSCSINLGVVALDQRHFLRRLVREVVPMVIQVVAHFQRPALAVRVHRAHGDEIVLGVEGAPVGHSERFVGSGMTDRTPDVEYPHEPFV